MKIIVFTIFVVSLAIFCASNVCAKPAAKKAAADAAAPASPDAAKPADAEQKAEPDAAAGAAKKDKAATPASKTPSTCEPEPKPECPAEKPKPECPAEKPKPKSKPTSECIQVLINKQRHKNQPNPNLHIEYCNFKNINFMFLVAIGCLTASGGPAIKNSGARKNI